MGTIYLNRGQVQRTEEGYQGSATRRNTHLEGTSAANLQVEEAANKVTPIESNLAAKPKRGLLPSYPGSRLGENGEGGWWRLTEYLDYLIEKHAARGGNERR